MPHKINHERKQAPPLDTESLGNLALHYVARYATTSKKLRRYLDRKLRERGWDDEIAPDMDQIVERFVNLGYIDDLVYGRTRVRTMVNRGYGARRIAQSLNADGLTPDASDALTREDDNAMWQAANRLAQRRKIGPYSEQEADRATKQRQIGIFLRAGHSMEMTRLFVDALPGEHPKGD